jgi:ABC-type antimicrobial peptide transport system permease subunit
MALGATRAGVAALVVRESLLVTGAGVAIGAPAAVAGARLISNRLFGVSATDPATIGGAVLLLCAVAAVSAWAPAHRASRVDPSVALRCE